MTASRFGDAGEFSSLRDLGLRYMLKAFEARNDVAR